MHDDLVVGKILFFYAQTQAFGNAQAAPIEQLSDQFGGAFHLDDHRHGFLVREHGRDAFGAVYAWLLPSQGR
jgi:hypothetical protein